jgi:hypothetical protein
MALGEVGLGDVDWIDRAQDNERWGSIKCWEIIQWLNNWWPLE